MSDTLTRVMDQAASAAESAPANSGNALVQTSQSGGAVQQYQRPTLKGIAESSGMNVDLYLTMKDTGLRLGDNKNPLFKTAKVRIDMRKVTPILSVRANRQGQTTFIKSYDGGMTTSQGQNFQQQLDYLRATNEKVDGPYPSVEIPAELLADVGGAKKGTKIGITPPITGVKYFGSFYEELEGLGLEASVIDVELNHLYQSNSKGNEWGVVTFNNPVAAE